MPRVEPSSDTPTVPPRSPLLARIISSLDDDKAEDIVTVDLGGRSSLCDGLVIATGRSARHVAALAENLSRRLKDWGLSGLRIEGLSQGDWVLIDTGDVVVHLFRAEVRTYYDLEGMWSHASLNTSAPPPKEHRCGSRSRRSAVRVSRPSRLSAISIVSARVRLQHASVFRSWNSQLSKPHAQPALKSG
jgi:ribosome-associated protein